jgi:hypothetical protein
VLLTAWTIIVRAVTPGGNVSVPGAGISVKSCGIAAVLVVPTR